VSCCSEQSSAAPASARSFPERFGACCYTQPGERAGLLSAYFVVGYLSFSLPALAAGFLAPIVGLRRTADFYGIGVILLAITSLAITLLQGRRA
jgi:hypothetical protein